MAKAEKSRERLLDEINEKSLLLKGSLNQVYRRCGNPNCRCARGERHGPFYLLTWSEGGKTRSKHIPREKASQVEEMIANYRKAKRLLDELSRANLELVSSGRNKK
ncbi:MAG: hypothetical protein L6427_13075 [Actinomycetia bacterium]|nr:hypothetical protein [Actinomycetes bacterium]